MQYELILREVEEILSGISFRNDPRLSEDENRERRGQDVAHLRDQLYIQISSLREFRRSQDQKGLTAARIEKFRHFAADQSNAGDRCPVCLEDFEAGKQLVELDCGGEHLLCKVCTDKWFSDHKTCPSCRGRFLPICFYL